MLVLVFGVSAGVAGLMALSFFSAGLTLPSAVDVDVGGDVGGDRFTVAMAEGGLVSGGVDVVVAAVEEEEDVTLIIASLGIATASISAIGAPAVLVVSTTATAANACI